MRLLKNLPLLGIDIFLEKRKTRQYVGMLRFDDKANEFVFKYDNSYLISKNVISMGPEFPFRKQEFRQQNLFPSFLDRLPSRENSAYEDYCRMTDISPEETNQIVLLVTIGKRGPSSFVFEPHYQTEFDYTKVKQFRLHLGLTTREFSHCFDITQSLLVNIENGKQEAKEVLKRLEIYYFFPKIALYKILVSGGFLHTDKYKHVIESLKEMVETRQA